MRGLLGGGCGVRGGGVKVEGGWVGGLCCCCCGCGLWAWGCNRQCGGGLLWRALGGLGRRSSCWWSAGLGVGAGVACAGCAAAG